MVPLSKNVTSQLIVGYVDGLVDGFLSLLLCEKCYYFHELT